MSNPIDDGGSAFPNPPKEFWYGTSRIESFDKVGGMTLRDWFAGKALSGMMNQPSNQRSLAVDDAAYCYAIADAMIAARKAIPTEP